MTTITTTDVAVGQVTDPSVINNNFGNVKATVNGNIDNSNVASGAAIAVSKLAPGTDGQILRTVAGAAAWDAEGAAAGEIPVGSLVMFGGAAAPSGWLLCDGSAISRTTFADLFTAIGTAYGAGDGSTTFNIPDLRGRLPVGKGSNTSVDSLGENDGAAEASRRPQHTHSVTPATFNWTPGGTSGADDIAVTTTTGTPSYLVLNFIVKH